MDETRVILRDEPGRYRMTFHAGARGAFDVEATAVEPVTLTLRTEDAWNCLPCAERRFLYTVRVTDGTRAAAHTFRDVAPDARFQFDLASRAAFAFTPQEGPTP